MLLYPHCTQMVCNADYFFRRYVMNKTKRLTESAMLIAIAVVLELVSKSIIPELPFGGQVTVAAMLPVVLVAYRRGVRWGLTTGLCYSFVQMALGARTVSAAFQPGYFGDGAMLGNALIMCLCDYVLAFSLLGLGGCFRNVIKEKSVALAAGSVIALSARYLAHILSGYVLFSGWAEWFFTQEGFPAWGAGLVERLSPEMLGLVYSVVYNGMYMIPEIVLTAVAAVFLAKVPGVAVKNQ